ncbi:PAS domain S-box protein [Megalodesulfovibrio paquesii]
MTRHPRLSSIVERTIASRLRLPVLAFGVLLGGLLALAQYRTVLQANRELAAAMSRYVQQHVETAQAQLQSLATLTAGASPATAEQAMRALQQNARYFDRLIHLDTAGGLVRAFPDGPTVLSQYDVAETGGLPRVVSRPHRSPDTGHLVVDVECRIPGGGAMVGLLNLQTLTDSMRGMLVGDEDALLLADEAGGVIVTPASLGPQADLNIADWPSFQQAESEEEEEGTVTLQQVAGRLSMVVPQALPRTGWVLLISRPVSSMLQPALLACSGYLGGVVLLYVMLVVALRQEMRRRVTRPLLEFAQALSGLRPLDVEAPAIMQAATLDGEGQTFAELDELAGAFAGMAGELRERESALRASEGRLRDLYVNAIEGIFQIGPDGKVLHCNPALAQMFGYQDEEDVRRNAVSMPSIYARPEQRALVLAMLAEHGFISGYELPMLRKDGSVIWVAVNAVAIRDAQGQLLRIDGMLADVTRRKQSEEALAASQEFFHVVFQGVTEGLLVHDVESGRIVDANQRACDLFGYTREELLLLHVADISQGEPPYSFREVREHIRQTRRQGSLNLEWRSRRRNGELFWSEVNLSLVTVGGVQRCIATIRDISERKENAQAREQAENRYRLLVQNAPVGIFRSTVDGKLLSANPEFARIQGDASPQASSDRLGHLGQDMYARPEDRQALLTRLLHTDAVQEAELQFKRKDGTLYWGSLTARLVRDERGQPTHIEGFQMDITDRKVVDTAREQAREQLEQQVALRTRELRQANTRLLELDRLKTSFLSSASHELRTPLTSILGFAKITSKLFHRYYLTGDSRIEPLAKIPRRQCGERIAGNLDIIAREGGRLTRLVNDLLDINAIESGMMIWRDTEVSLPELLEDAAASVRGMLPASGRVRLVTAVESNLPRLHLDRDKMVQVLQNLLGNAAKFTAAGEIRLSASLIREALEPGFDICSVELRVADTGHGIPETALEAVFEKFYQILPEGRDGDKPRGTGLGLAICREIVEHYGGRIWAESVLGQGATFVVRLPAPQVAAEAEDTPGAGSPPDQGAEKAA